MKKDILIIIIATLILALIAVFIHPNIDLKSTVVGRAIIPNSLNYNK